MNISSKISFFLFLFTLLTCLQACYVKTGSSLMDVISGKLEGNYVGGMDHDLPVFFGERVDATVEVSTVEDLLSSLKSAKTGDVIYINDSAVIDLTKHKRISIPAGISIVSGRGTKHSAGALIKADLNGTNPLFVAAGDDIKMMGLRIQGPDTSTYANGQDAFEGVSVREAEKNRVELHKKNMYTVPLSTGIRVTGRNFKFINNEIWGWTYAAISLDSNAFNALISNSYIHHNQRFGLGYGVLLKKHSSAIIKANKFDYNGHSVTGTGEVDISYEVSYNLFMGNRSRDVGWDVDMHGGKDRNDGTNIAGKRLLVHHNFFFVNKGAKAVVFRGVPTERAEVHDNFVQRRSRSGSLKERAYILQYKDVGNFKTFNNTVN